MTGPRQHNIKRFRRASENLVNFWQLFRRAAPLVTAGHARLLTCVTTASRGLSDPAAEPAGGLTVVVLTQIQSSFARAIATNS